MAVLEVDRAEALARAKKLEPQLYADLTEDQIQVVQARVKKACITKGEQSWMEVAVEALPPEEIKIIWQLGVEARVNSTGFSKVPKATDQEGVEEAMAVAAQNLEKLYNGELRAPVGLGAMKKGKKKVSNQLVNAKAMLIAKQMVKDTIRSNGEKIGDYKAKDITTAAKALLEDDEYAFIWEEAEQEVERQRKEQERISSKAGEIKLAIKADPEKVKEREAKAKSKTRAVPQRKGRTTELHA